MDKKKLPLYIGCASLFLAVLLFFLISLPTIGGKKISFPSTYKEKNVTLQGTYFEAKGAEYAVVICPGYSCDREKWRPMANLYVKNGISVFLFDYAGQGASSSTIGFDNAKTDAIPAEIDDAIMKVCELSGIAEDHIILMGHSMGGRSILRLLYDYHDPEAATTVTSKDIRNVILFSPEVNYHFNAQASLFAGTSDDAEEPWHSYNEDYIGNTNVYLYGSTADDIVSDGDILAIAAHMGITDIPANGVCSFSRVNQNGTKVTVGVTGGVLHSYQMYSAKFADYVKEALSDILGREVKAYPSFSYLLIYAGWFLTLLGLGLILHALNKGTTPKEEKSAEGLIVLEDPKKFLLRKLLMWLPGTLMAFLICCLCVCLPFGSPVMNLPYMCFIAGYGIVMLLAYRKGKFKGTLGKLAPLSWKIRAEKKQVIFGVVISVVLCFSLWYVLYCSMYRLVPFNFRLLFCVLAGLLMFIGYYVGGEETDMLERAGASGKVKLLYNLIQYIPLFLLVLFYMIIKSYSGMIGQIQNMLLLYIFCVPLSTFIRRRTGSKALGSFTAAFLFQTLMITSAALISMF